MSITTNYKSLAEVFYQHVVCQWFSDTKFKVGHDMSKEGPCLLSDSITASLLLWGHHLFFLWYLKMRGFGVDGFCRGVFCFGGGNWLFSL